MGEANEPRSSASEAILVEIGLAIGSAIEIDQLLEMVMGHVTALLGAERGTLYLVDHQRQEIWSKVLQGGGLREIRLPIGSGIAGATVLQRKLLNISDAYADPRFNAEVDQASGFHTRSILCAPIFAATAGLRPPSVPEVVGAIQVLNRCDGQRFGPEDERAIAATAAQLAVALENARLLAAERRKVRELDLLYGLERDLASAADPSALIDVALQRALELCSAEAAAALLLDEKNDELTFRTALGGAGSQLLHTRVPLRTGIAGRVADDGVGRIVKDAEAESPVAREIAARTGYRSRSLCAAPIACDDRILGVLELLNRRDGEFG
jgi:adenylate cyclase